MTYEFSICRTLRVLRLPAVAFFQNRRFNLACLERGGAHSVCASVRGTAAISVFFLDCLFAWYITGSNFMHLKIYLEVKVKKVDRLFVTGEKCHQFGLSSRVLHEQFAQGIPGVFYIMPGTVCQWATALGAE